MRGKDAKVEDEEEADIKEGKVYCPISGSSAFYGAQRVCQRGIGVGEAIKTPSGTDAFYVP